MTSEEGWSQNIDLEPDLYALLECIVEEDDIEIDQSRLKSLLLALKNQQAWKLLALVSRFAMKSAPSPELVAIHLQALRGSGLHSDALELLSKVPRTLMDSEALTQWGAILCEAGDFSGALEVLESFSSVSTECNEDQLIMRAWAHQNLPGGDHPQKALEALKLALERLATLPAQEAMQNRHPTAYEGARQYHRDLRKMKMLWCTKSSGDALDRIATNRAQAEAKWQQVVADLAPNLRSRAADPFLLRIAGWCYYRLGQFEHSLEAYRRSIESNIDVYRPLFDYALIVHSQSSAAISVELYKRALTYARCLPPLRRTGLIRVALFELLNASDRDVSLRDGPHTEEIWRELTEEFLEACSEIPSGAGPTKTRLVNAVQDMVAQSEIGASASRSDQVVTQQVVDWLSSQVVGINNPEPLVCGLFTPIIQFRGDEQSFLVTIRGSSLPCDSSAVRVSACPPATDIRRFVTPEQATPTMRVAYLSAEALHLMRHHGIGLPSVAQGAWIRTSHSDEELVYCATADEGRKILDNIAEMGLTILTSGLSDKSRERRLDAELAKLCFFAAQTSNKLYISALVFSLIHPDASNLQPLRPDLGGDLLPPFSTLSSYAERFQGLLQNVSFGSADEQQYENARRAMPYILSRVAEVAMIDQSSLRIREAFCAASELDAAISRFPLTNDLIEHTIRRLCDTASIYPSEDVEFLALAREPAFYCSLKQTIKGKPALDTLLFFKTVAAMHKDGVPLSPLGLRVMALGN